MATTVNAKTKNMWMIGRQSKFNEKKAMVINGQPGDIQEQWEGIKDLVTKDALIAIASGDPGVEYYLLKLTGNGPEVVTERATDDWSCTHRAGAEVFCRNFLVAKTAVSEDRLYKLDTTKKAVVNATTARFICPDLQTEKSMNGTFYKVNDDLHLDILGSLDGF